MHICVSKGDGDMDLLNSFRTTKDESEHWVALEQTANAPEFVSLKSFKQKLDRALSDLGRLDYSLKASLEELGCDTTIDTYDHLHLHVAETVKPELARAMHNLADAIDKARKLADEVIADGHVCGASCGAVPRQ
jgi:hypothetical protein